MCSAGILTQLQSFRFVLSCTFFNPKGFKHIEADDWHFPDDIFKYISLNENVWILIKISLSLFTKGSINNIPALVQIMAWHRSGYKPLCESMMVSLLMHICITPPQWGKSLSRARYMAVYLGYTCTFQAMNTLFDMRDKLDKQDDSPLCQWLRRHGAASITKYEKMEAQGTDKPLEYTAGSTKRFEAYIDPENNFNMRDKLSQVGYAFVLFFQSLLSWN